MKHLEENFKLAQKQDWRAPKALYDLFSAKMLAVVNSYTNNIHDAEDTLLDVFLKCFKKISDCKNWKVFHLGNKIESELDSSYETVQESGF